MFIEIWENGFEFNLSVLRGNKGSGKVRLGVWAGWDGRNSFFFRVYFWIGGIFRLWES